MRLGQDLRGLQDLIYERWHRLWPQRSIVTAAGERVAVLSLPSIRAAASISNTGCKVGFGKYRESYHPSIQPVFRTH